MTGAHYEIELYVMTGDLPGLDAGVYRFNPADVSLRLLRKVIFANTWLRATAWNPWWLTPRDVHLHRGDGRVSNLKDGLPENIGSNDRSSRHITLDNVVGNYVILDLGRGHFAVYAHLQPGSLKVKLGDQVKAKTITLYAKCKLSAFCRPNRSFSRT